MHTQWNACEKHQTHTNWKYNQWSINANGLNAFEHLNGKHMDTYESLWKLYQTFANICTTQAHTYDKTSKQYDTLMTRCAHLYEQIMELDDK